MALYRNSVNKKEKRDETHVVNAYSGNFCIDGITCR